MLTLLHDLTQQNRLPQISYQFAKFIDSKQQTGDYTEQQKNLAILLSALVSSHLLQGNSCLDLTSESARNPFNLKDKTLDRDFYSELIQKTGTIDPLAWPALFQHHVAFSHHPNHVAPLLFQQDRLYFYRYWQAENRIAHYLQNAVNDNISDADVAQDKAILNHFFEPTEQTDWQRIAAATALNKRFSLISGGPGTGKTRTVARLLASLQLKQLEQKRPLLKIALAAPTGKAAARLKESIQNNLAALHLPKGLDVPTQASTIHRLIGMRPDSDLPRHHPQNPLHIDLLVVDEASMIDLFVMEKLCNALKPTTRLILLGDKDQLASVEAGNIMGEIAGLMEYGYSTTHRHYLAQTTNFPTFKQDDVARPALCDSLCELKISHRFSQNSGIGKLANETNYQRADSSWKLLSQAQLADIHLIKYPMNTEWDSQHQWSEHCVNLVVAQAVSLYREYLALVKQRMHSPQQVSVAHIFKAFQKVRFLAALRVSELGVERLNQRIAEALRQAGLIQFNHSRDSYYGKPILITANSPQQHVFSGDIGMMLPDEQGNLRVYFDTLLEVSGDSPQDSDFLNISLSRLPEYEPAYVMTVHKSQGSEFDHTLLVMPHMSAPVLTKELVYTAITRAKNTFTLFSEEKIWKQAVNSRITRQSGLKQQLLSASKAK